MVKAVPYRKVSASSPHQPAGAVGSRFYEVTKYLTKTEHIQLITGIVVGDAWWSRLGAPVLSVVQHVVSRRYLRAV